jgi:small subunit ribosomal protein S4
MVSHGHIFVNGRRINIASHKVKIGDKVAIREGSRTSKVFAGLTEKITASTPSYMMSVDPSTLTAEIKAIAREVEPMFDTQKVLEYYSR